MTKRILAVAATGALLAGGMAMSTAHAAKPVAKNAMTTVMLHGEHGYTAAGTAAFEYSAKTNITTVSLRVTGLTAMTVHPAHIHAGSSCTANGPVLYSFRPLGSSKMMMTEAGANGIMRASTSFRGTYVGQKLYINVHLGPDLKGAHFTPIACGVVSSMM